MIRKFSTRLLMQVAAIVLAGGLVMAVTGDLGERSVAAPRQTSVAPAGVSWDRSKSGMSWDAVLVGVSWDAGSRPQTELVATPAGVSWDRSKSGMSWDAARAGKSSSLAKQRARGLV
jgi:hypothetical protein